MDPTSTHHYPTPDSLAIHGHSNPHLDHQSPHILHHHVSAPPPPPQHFSIHPPIPSHGLPSQDLPSHDDISLGVLDGTDSSVFHNTHAHTHSLPLPQRLETAQELPILRPNHHQHQLDAPPVTAPPPPPPPALPLPPPPPHSAPPSHSGHGNNGQYGVPIAPAISQLQQEDDYLASLAAATAPESLENRPHGQLVNKIVVHPPDLAAWREKLFSVDETILLSNEEFETYFPHIDNVYSHRSTQKYKRKPFVSHYWDCRMKGRPPGTPKSDDPTKKKRKRNARERDLCDVKIKITEYYPGATLQLDDSVGSGAYPSPEQPVFYDGNGRPIQPGEDGEKFWTIQRVNGNGGNGKGDGVAGPHKHSLAKSDEIKKSTVQRFVSAQEKEAKAKSKPFVRKTTGPAWGTAKKHLKEHELKLYAACFCPFSQRVWIALEAKGIQYQYCETDPYRRPTQLLEANPIGTVPAIREGDWASGESAIILEYLEDHDQTVPLFPTDPRLKANCRLWIDHINSKIVPSYFALLREDDVTQQGERQGRLQNNIMALVQAADERGPYFLGGDLCLVDVHFAPFVLRLSRVLGQLRNWTDPVPGTRWHQWVEALEQNPHIHATISNKEVYVDTIELFLNGFQTT
ncbi:hypothetical protein BJ170DRAFT_688758 [Xylariales sp. AK1849]|nr:hypothetical protein BJ170DRAFT_688758 [Xylariales sp. AK1849]